MKTHLLFLLIGLWVLSCGCRQTDSATLSALSVERVGSVQRLPTDRLASYTLSYLNISGPPDSVAQRINGQIRNECKLLLLNAYDEGVVCRRDSLLWTLADKSVEEVGNGFLNRVRQNDADLPRFWDSLRVDTTFTSPRLLSVRFYNLRNDGGAKDVSVVIYRVFDRQTGRVVPMRDFVADTVGFAKAVNAQFLKSGVTGLNGEPITFAWGDHSMAGLSGAGLIMSYPYYVMGEGSAYDTEVVIPWPALTTNRLLHTDRIF